MKFWTLNPYYKRSDWKTWLSERFYEALTNKLWIKKKYMLAKCAEMEQNRIMFTPYGFIHLRDNHRKFLEKMK